MARQKNLLADPRYKDFVSRYAFDLTRFCIEVCGITPTHQQIELFDSVTPAGSRTSVSSGHGCFAAGTMMMRSDGSSVAVEDVRVGDRLMGPGGREYRTVEQLKRGREAMYRFTYSDGSSHVFNESHYLVLAPGVKYKARGKTDILDVTVREWLTWPKTRRERYYVFRTPVASFEREQKRLAVPPYILGVWLGDGTTGVSSITSPDQEIIDEWAAYVSAAGCLLKPRVNSTSKAGVPCYSLPASRILGTSGKNPVAEALKEAVVFERKHIPDAYKYASWNDRLELLAGLMDTDGHFDVNSGGLDFIQKDESIARDVVWLARSVGCHATYKECRKECVNNGVWGTYYRVHIGRGCEVIPCRVKRKQGDGRVRHLSGLEYSIRSVEPLGEGDYYGFTLDGDHRFLDADFNVLRNTGKTASFSVIALWHLSCYYNSNTFITAPKLGTVSQGVWKEFADRKTSIKAGPHAWIADYIEIETEKVYIVGSKLNWFVMPKTAPKGSPENLAGTHRDWLLWLADESSGIPDANFGIIGGALTDARNRFCMASQPTRPSGFFYDTHNALSRENGGPWNALVFNSEESPLVSDQFIRDKLLEYGGRDAVEYQIKVLGRFPENSDKYLVGRKAVESRVNAEPVIKPDERFGYLLLVDVGAGEYRDKSVAVLAKVTGNSDFGEDARRMDVIDVPLFTNTRNIQDFTGEVFNLAASLSNVTVLIDAGGMGIAVCQQLETLGLPNVRRVKWGNPCFKTRYRERFFNQRAQACVLASKAIKEGRITFTDKHKKDLLDQASRIPFHFDEKARYVIEKKEDMRADGLPSPDLWDAICFGFLEDATFVQAEAHVSDVNVERKASAREKAATALDSLD